MLQSMLADRFRLAFHRETKELPVYNLVAAKGGLKIVAAKEGGCITFDPKNPLAPPRPGETPPRVCGGVRMSRNSMEAYGISMTALSSDLSDSAGAHGNRQNRLRGNIRRSSRIRSRRGHCRRWASRAAGRPRGAVDLHRLTGTTGTQSRILQRPGRGAGSRSYGKAL